MQMSVSVCAHVHVCTQMLMDSGECFLRFAACEEHEGEKDRTIVTEANKPKTNTEVY